MFILTDGKNYVMENPMKQGAYISTTSPVQAKRFTFKQARSLLQNKKKALSWIRSYHMVNQETGSIEKDIPKYSDEGIFCREREFEFDESIIDAIKQEVNSVMGLASWDIGQLNTYKAMLNQGLQYYDLVISDIEHARMDKRPPAHIMTKIDKLRNSMEEKRRDIKQTRYYIDTLIKAINEQWPISKTKIELNEATYKPYKGRTKYFSIAKDLLKNY